MKLFPRCLLPMKLQMFWQTKSCLHPIKDQRLTLQSIRDVLCKMFWQGLIFCCILCIRNGRRTLVFKKITLIFLISALHNWGWSTSPKIFRNLKHNRILDCHPSHLISFYLSYTRKHFFWNVKYPLFWADYSSWILLSMKLLFIELTVNRVIHFI